MIVKTLIKKCTTFPTIGLWCNKQFSTTVEASMSELQNKFTLPARYAGSENSVWNEYSQLAATYKPLNLGQGFPDFAAPNYVTNALAQVATSSNPLLQQYTRGYVS